MKVMEAAGEYPAEINMGLTEITLMVLGIAAFVASFLIPEKFNSQSNVDSKKIKEEMKDFLDQEMQKNSFQIEEKADETISAAVEKTERYLERITNEKIMAVQEYSDTVLSQIHKNHEEAVFLYDMLNNKHVQVKNTANEIHTKVEDAKADLKNTIQEKLSEIPAEETVEDLPADTLKTENRMKDIKNIPLKKEEKEVVDELPKEKKTTRKKTTTTTKKKTSTTKAKTDNKESNIEVQFEPGLDMGSNKDKILSLHKEGKSNMAIAKSLGLGIGEVKLIIDLFEQNQ